MESQRAVVQNPAPPRAGLVLPSPSNEAIAIIRKQWHSMPLLPEGPQFIESVYSAQGIFSPVIKKTPDQIERILQSRPTVKPLMKRRRLLSRAGKIPEKPVTSPPSMPVMESSLPVLEPSLPVLEPSLPVLEPSLPVLEPSAPVSSETITIYAGITDTPSVTRLSDVAQPEDSCSKDPPLTVTKVTTLPLAVASPKLPLQVSKLTAPPSMNSTTVLPASAIPTPSSSHFARTLTSLPGTSHSLSSPPLTLTDVSLKSIFDPVTTSTTSAVQTFPVKSSIAKKSTTPRPKNIVPKDKIELLKSKYGIKPCLVILYDYAKDYGSTMRFGERDPAKSSKKTEVGKEDKKKDKKKLKDPKPKPLPKPNLKKRDTPKNGDQPLAKKIKKSGSLETPVQTNTVPKIRLQLRNDMDDPIGNTMLDNSPKDDSNNATSNKENIMAAIGSCDGSEVNPKQALWKRSVPPPNPAGKKGIDIKSVSCTTGSIQSDEICKSDKALIIRIPQTNAPMEKVECSKDACFEKEKSCGNKTEPPSNVPTKPQLLTGTAPAQVASTESSAQTSKDDKTASASELSLSSTPLTQVKDKPVISLEMYHARKNSMKSGQGGSNSSSPTHPGTDATTPSPKHNGHTSPGPNPDKTSLPGLKLKQPSTSNDATTPSPNGNGFVSTGQGLDRSPENKQPQKHKMLQPVTAQDSPKKAKTGTLNGASTPIPEKVGQKFVYFSPQQNGMELIALPQSALKFVSVHKETHNNNGADPWRKSFLSTVAENNNNSMCVGFEQVTSLPVDNTATAELDLRSVALQPLLLDRHHRTDYSHLRMVQWENCCCYSCNKVFPLHNDWCSHCKSCK